VTGRRVPSLPRLEPRFPRHRHLPTSLVAREETGSRAPPPWPLPSSVGAPPGGISPRLRGVVREESQPRSSAQSEGRSPPMRGVLPHRVAGTEDATLGSPLPLLECWTQPRRPHTRPS